MDIKSKNTLEEIFEIPVSKKVFWGDIEHLFQELNANQGKLEKNRFYVDLFEQIRVFHRPSSQQKVDAGVLLSLRKWLECNGVTP